MDNTSFSLEKAQDILNGGISEAQELIRNPSSLNGLLAQIEKKVKELPGLTDILSDIVLMIYMVKSYITKEYPDVSPKVIATLVSAFLYLIKKKDIIPDNVPLVGHLDDIAVITLALKFVEPELRKYEAWKKSNGR